MISRLSAPAASPRSAAWLHELYVNAKWLMIPHAAGVVVRFGSTLPRPALRVPEIRQFVDRAGTWEA
jgi:hypothetical protein